MRALLVIVLILLASDVQAGRRCRFHAPVVYRQLFEFKYQMQGSKSLAVIYLHDLPDGAPFIIELAKDKFFSVNNYTVEIDGETTTYRWDDGNSLGVIQFVASLYTTPLQKKGDKRASGSILHHGQRWQIQTLAGREHMLANTGNLKEELEFLFPKKKERPVKIIQILESEKIERKGVPKGTEFQLVLVKLDRKIPSDTGRIEFDGALKAVFEVDYYQPDATKRLDTSDMIYIYFDSRKVSSGPKTVDALRDTVKKQQVPAKIYLRTH